MDDPEKVDPVTAFMDVYKANIQYDVSLDKLKFIIVVRGYLHNKGIFGYTWSPIESMMTLKYFLADFFEHKVKVHQLYFVG